MMTTRTPDTSAPPDDCTGCPLHDAAQAPAAIERRAFLRAAGMAIASLGLVGLGSSAAAAMPVRSISALGTYGDGAQSEKH